MVDGFLDLNSEMRWMYLLLLMLVLHTCRDAGCEFSYPQSADQMRQQQLRARLCPDEQLAAEECFALYCKPVELYNIIQRRAIRNVSSILVLQLHLTWIPCVYHITIMCKWFEIPMISHWLLQPAFLQRCLHYKIHASRKKRYTLWLYCRTCWHSELLWSKSNMSRKRKDCPVSKRIFFFT